MAIAQQGPESPRQRVAGPSRLSRIGMWALGSGAVGLFGGYFGNVIQAQYPGSEAPLVGILFTGPLAFGVGAGIGLVLSNTRASVTLNVLLLLGWLLLVAKISWTLTEPGFESAGEVVEARVVGCTELAAVLPERLEHWRTEAERVSKEFERTIVRPDWERHLTAMMSARPGVVLTVERGRAAWVRERRWSSGRVDRVIDQFVDSPRQQRVFLDVDDGHCQPEVMKLVGPYQLCFEHSGQFPPTRLPEYLEVWVMRSVPERFAAELKTGSKNGLLNWFGERCPRTAAPEP